ncbi:hypothetical protein J22TS3_22760 [Paenibacillus sp. J22TS3]|nr:hypothetical protein J22TS3_22760 [Paenibacillus sp. J22TS3]
MNQDSLKKANRAIPNKVHWKLNKKILIELLGNKIYSIYATRNARIKETRKKPSNEVIPAASFVL